MRKSKNEAAETRQKIVQIASELFRVKGIGSTGIAEIMETAGLTNGGFYKHFESKDQLVQEALKTSTSELAQRFNDENIQEMDSETIIKTYLSHEHQEGLEWGCPIVGIGSELGRIDKESRGVATEGIEQLVSSLEKHISSTDEQRKLAMSSVSMMVGALTLSRIVDDKKLAEEFLKTAEQMAIELTSRK